MPNLHFNELAQHHPPEAANRAELKQGLDFTEELTHLDLRQKMLLGACQYWWSHHKNILLDLKKIKDNKSKVAKITFTKKVGEQLNQDLDYTPKGSLWFLNSKKYWNDIERHVLMLTHQARLDVTTAILKKEYVQLNKILGDQLKLLRSIKEALDKAVEGPPSHEQSFSVNDPLYLYRQIVALADAESEELPTIELEQNDGQSVRDEIEAAQRNDMSAISELIHSNPSLNEHKLQLHTLAPQRANREQFFSTDLGCLVQKDNIINEWFLWRPNWKTRGNGAGGAERKATVFYLPAEFDLTVIPFGSIFANPEIKDHSEIDDYEDQKIALFKHFQDKKMAIFTHTTDFLITWQVLFEGKIGVKTNESEQKTVQFDEGFFADAFDFTTEQNQEATELTRNTQLEKRSYRSRLVPGARPTFLNSDYIMEGHDPIFIFDQTKIPAEEVGFYQHHLIKPRSFREEDGCLCVMVTEYQRKLMLNAIAEWKEDKRKEIFGERDVSAFIISRPKQLVVE